MPSSAVTCYSLYLWLVVVVIVVVVVNTCNTAGVLFAQLGTATSGEGHEARRAEHMEQQPAFLQSCIPQVQFVASPDAKAASPADPSGDPGEGLLIYQVL